MSKSRTHLFSSPFVLAPNYQITHYKKTKHSNIFLLQFTSDSSKSFDKLGSFLWFVCNNFQCCSKFLVVVCKPLQKGHTFYQFMFLASLCRHLGRKKKECYSNCMLTANNTHIANCLCLPHQCLGCLQTDTLAFVLYRSEQHDICYGLSGRRCWHKHKTPGAKRLITDVSCFGLPYHGSQWGSVYSSTQLSPHAALSFHCFFRFTLYPANSSLALISPGTVYSGKYWSMQIQRQKAECCK